MPLAVDDILVVATSDNGELFLDNGLIVIEEEGKRRIVGRWDPVISS